jgi:predicted nucleotidyltransferase
MHRFDLVLPILVSVGQDPTVTGETHVARGAPPSVDEVRRVVMPRLLAASDVVAAWVFGSVARGEANPGSDVDVAIFTNSRAPQSLADLHLDLQADLAALLGREVDLVVVDHAPVDLVHRVLRDGVLFIDRDPAARVAFEVATRSRYFDMAPVWAEYRRMAGSGHR